MLGIGHFTVNGPFLEAQGKEGKVNVKKRNARPMLCQKRQNPNNVRTGE
jgi:hypothetical protein